MSSSTAFTAPSLDTAEGVKLRVLAISRLVKTGFVDGEISWRIWGSGPPLLLIHGGHGSWAHWIRNVEVLALTHTVLVPDMPGYGASDKLRAPFTQTRLAQAVSAGIDRLVPAGTELFVVAFSFGATVAGAILPLQPRRIKGLVLVGPAGLGLTRPPMGEMRDWRGLTGAAEQEAHAHNIRTLLIQDPARVDDLAISIQISNANGTRFRSRDISHTDVLRRDLGTCLVRIAAIWGEQDATCRGSIDAGSALLRSFDPDAGIAVIAGSGHWVQYENPAEFNAALLSQLARLRDRN